MVDETNELSPGAMNRRNALKAGAAIGIGAVALAGPQIGILGSVPAYAATCSGGLTCVTSPKESANVGSPCGPNVALNNFPASFSGNGITATLVGSCLNGTDGVTVSSSLSLCQVTISFFRQSDPDTLVFPSTGPVGASGGFVAFPNVLDNDPRIPQGALKATITVCCSDEASCF